MAEQTFLDESGILVTNARFVVPAQTYAMSGVTSVAAIKNVPSKKGPIVLIVIGLILMIAGDAGIILGLLALAGGIAWLVLNKPEYIVLLNSASGETRALHSKDEDFISRVIVALNESIIARG